MDYSAGLRGSWLIPVLSAGQDAQQKPRASGREKAAQQGGFCTLTFKYKGSGHGVHGLIPAHCHALEVKLEGAFSPRLDLHFYSTTANNNLEEGEWAKGE